MRASAGKGEDHRPGFQLARDPLEAGGRREEGSRRLPPRG